MVVALASAVHLVPETTEQITSTILAQLSGNGEYRVEITSVDSSLLSSITLHGISVYDLEGQPVGSADTIQINTPVYRLLFRRLYPKEISITIANLRATIDEDILTAVSQAEGNTENLFSNRTITLSLIDAHLTLDTETLAATFGGIYADVSVQPGNLIQAELQVDQLSWIDSQGSGKAAQLLVRSEATKSTVNFSVSVKNTEYEHTSLRASWQQAKFSAQTPSWKDFFSGTFSLAADVSHVQGISEIIAARSTAVTATAQVIEGSVLESRATLPDFYATYDQWSVSADPFSLQYTQQNSEPATAQLMIADQLLVQHQVTEEPVLLTEGTVITLQVTDKSRALQLDADRIIAHPYPQSSLPDQLQKITLIDTYALVIEDLVHQEKNGEASASYTLNTLWPFLSSIQGNVSGSLTLDTENHINRSQVTLENMRIDELPGEFTAQMNYLPEASEGSAISADVDHTSGMQLSFTYSEVARIALQLQQFAPYDFISVIERFAPTVSPVVASNTSLQGNLSITSTPDLSSGRIIGELGVANLAVDEQRFNVATTLSLDFNPQQFMVPLATVTTEGYRLSYEGSIDRELLFPEGKLQVTDVESGATIASADFERLAAQRYGYRIESPLVAESDFSGDVSWEDRDNVRAQGVLSIPGISYPLAITFDEQAGMLTLDSDPVTAQLDFLSVPGHITFDLAMNALMLPPSHSKYMQGQGEVNGSLAADFSLAEELFLISAPLVRLEGLSWENQDPFTVSFSFDADPQQLRIENMVYEDQQGTLTGYASIFHDSLRTLGTGKLNQLRVVSELSGSNDEQIVISLYPDEQESSVVRGLIEIDNVNLGRFFPDYEGVHLSTAIIGSTDLHTQALGHAQLSLIDLDRNRDFSLSLHLESWGILVDEGLYQTETTEITIDSVRFPYQGVSEIKAHFAQDFPTSWRDGTTRATVQASTELPSADSLFTWISQATTMDSLPPITVSHSDVALYGAIRWQDGMHTITLQDDVITVTPGTGGTVEGTYNLTNGQLQVHAKQGFPLPLTASGTLTGSTISLDVSQLTFDITHINALLLEPVIEFHQGTFYGSGIIDGELSNPDYFGTFSADSVEMTTFWTPGEMLSMKNPVVTISENLATVSPTPMVAVHTSGRLSRGVIQMQATVERWIIPHYRIDVLEIDNPVSIWIPLLGIDVNVEARAAGTFSIDGTPSEETLLGDVTVSDTQISFGLPELPSWVVEKQRTHIDMTLRTGRNVSFTFPNEESPILRATFNDDQRVDILVEAPSMATTFTGELTLRSGEIYYVQKNFYITEGSLKFPPVGTALNNDFMPRLNLRARLREFESDGNRIDIFLVLQDARFDDLNPRFESIPNRSTNEILELLGQSIVSTGSATDGADTSVVAVASAATDVISRLGLLQTTTISLGFSSVIRESLGLDVFTIRTNLLQNILFEALPGISADTTASPIARYLDNTTMYIGKYLFDELYLQGMIHLRRDRTGASNSFLANDLRIDTELSVEWTNPLAAFSLFTQPEELSVFELFDTMGFSITKRFEF
jgi:hypothetical protein